MGGLIVIFFFTHMIEVWYPIWLMVWNMNFIFNMNGCHPSHWRTSSFFKIIIAPPTSIMVDDVGWCWMGPADQTVMTYEADLAQLYQLYQLYYGIVIKKCQQNWI